MEVPPPKFFRLKPGGEVRLEIRLHHQVRRSRQGRRRQHHRTALHRRPRQQDRRRHRRRKVKGTIHWVSAAHAIDAEVRLYDRLFTEAEPEKDGRDFKSVLNPHSLEVITAKLRTELERCHAGSALSVRAPRLFRPGHGRRCQTADPKLVFNRTITLKDTWAKEAQKG